MHTDYHQEHGPKPGRSLFVVYSGVSADVLFGARRFLGGHGAEKGKQKEYHSSPNGDDDWYRKDVKPVVFYPLDYYI